MGSESFICYHAMKHNRLFTQHPEMHNVAGIYCDESSEQTRNTDIHQFCIHYCNAIKNSDALATFQTSIVDEQKFFLENYNLPALHSRAIEPIHVINEKQIPWTHSLISKKVLIVSPFVETFKLQIEAGILTNLMKGDPVVQPFLPEQQFVFYKTYNSCAGNRPHKNWKETLDVMCSEIDQLEYDFALVSCGGYGLMICHHIKNKGKSSVYVGGGLQLMFGVMGRRWEQITFLDSCNKERFVRPSAKLGEVPKDFTLVEGGSYF